MPGLPFPLDLILGLSAVALVWLAAGALFRRLSRMSRVVRADTGPELRKSRWGDGAVNGGTYENCLRVVEFEGGWVVEVRWLLGGGRLWLPRAGTRVGPLEGAGSPSGLYRLLEGGGNRVTLEGELAEFVAEPTAAAVGGRDTGLSEFNGSQRGRRC